MVAVASRDALGRFTKADDDGSIPPQYRALCSRCGLVKDVRAFCVCVPQAEIDEHFASRLGSATIPDSAKKVIVDGKPLRWADVYGIDPNFTDPDVERIREAVAQVKSPVRRRWPWRKRR